MESRERIRRGPTHTETEHDHKNVIRKHIIEDQEHRKMKDLDALMMTEEGHTQSW